MSDAKELNVVCDSVPTIEDVAAILKQLNLGIRGFRLNYGHGSEPTLAISLFVKPPDTPVDVEMADHIKAYTDRMTNPGRTSDPNDSWATADPKVVQERIKAGPAILREGYTAPNCRCSLASFVEHLQAMGESGREEERNRKNSILKAQMTRGPSYKPSADYVEYCRKAANRAAHIVAGNATAAIKEEWQKALDAGAFNGIVPAPADQKAMDALKAATEQSFMMAPEAVEYVADLHCGQMADEDVLNCHVLIKLLDGKPGVHGYIDGLNGVTGTVIEVKGPELKVRMDDIDQPFRGVWLWMERCWCYPIFDKPEMPFDAPVLQKQKVGFEQEQPAEPQIDAGLRARQEQVLKEIVEPAAKQALGESLSIDWKHNLVKGNRVLVKVPEHTGHIDNEQLDGRVGTVYDVVGSVANIDFDEVPGKPSYYYWPVLTSWLSFVPFTITATYADTVDLTRIQESIDLTADRQSAIKECRCPECGGELDTGWECNDCGFDAMPEVKMDDAPTDSGDQEYRQEYRVDASEFVEAVTDGSDESQRINMAFPDGSTLAFDAVLTANAGEVLVTPVIAPTEAGQIFRAGDVWPENAKARFGDTVQINFNGSTYPDHYRQVDQQTGQVLEMWEDRGMRRYVVGVHLPHERYDTNSSYGTYELRGQNITVIATSTDRHGNAIKHSDGSPAQVDLTVCHIQPSKEDEDHYAKQMEAGAVAVQKPSDDFYSATWKVGDRVLCFEKRNIPKPFWHSKRGSIIDITPETDVVDALLRVKLDDEPDAVVWINAGQARSIIGHTSTPRATSVDATVEGETTKHDTSVMHGVVTENHGIGTRVRVYKRDSEHYGKIGRLMSLMNGPGETPQESTWMLVSFGDRRVAIPVDHLEVWPEEGAE